MVANNWKDYFINKGTSITCSNYSAELFEDVSCPNLDKNSILSRLSSDKGDSILIYFSKISKSIHLLHSITDLGNNNIDPESKLVALDGFKNDTSVPVQIDLDSLFIDISVHAPKIERLITITERDELITIEPPRTNPTKFKHLPFVLLPPILWEVFISSEDKSAASLFMNLIPKLKEIEESNKNNEECNEVANHCAHIAIFLWAAMKNIIPSISVAPPGDNEAVLHWAKLRHTHVFPTSQKSHPVPNDRQSLDSISKVIERSFQSFPGTENSEKTSKGFAKLHESTRNLILNASAQNSDIAATEPCDDCAMFFKTNSHGTARMFILKSLENKFGCNVSIAQGVIMNLYNGNFLRAFDESPSNFSPFSFPKKSLFGKKNPKQSA